MKKMLFICMVGSLFFLTSVATASEVVSTNIVGYQKISSVAPFYVTGPTFVSVLSFLEADPETDYKIKLSDIIIEGMSANLEFIQIMDPTTGEVSQNFTYVPSGTNRGWWEPYQVGSAFTKYDNYQFSISSGFICNFTMPTEKTITFAGEVMTGSTIIDLTGQIFPVVANFLPVDGLTLGDLTVEGMMANLEFIQIMDPATGEVSQNFTYVPSGTNRGWWVPYQVGSAFTKYDNEPFPAGAALIGNFSVAAAVKITFPDPMLFVAP